MPPHQNDAPRRKVPGTERHARVHALNETLPPAARLRVSALGLALCATGLLWAALGAAQQPERPGRFAGTYKIDGWESLEQQEIRHVFRLQEDGQFILSGEWPDHESTRFTGTWSLAGERTGRSRRDRPCYGTGFTAACGSKSTISGKSMQRVNPIT